MKALPGAQPSVPAFAADLKAGAVRAPADAEADGLSGEAAPSEYSGQHFLPQ